MREILFRGKRTDNKEWIEGSYIKSVVKACPFDYITPSYPTKPTQIYAITLGQYTGLIDKNGKKIFEGDILEFPDRLVEVFWHTHFGCWDSNFLKYTNKENGRVNMSPISWGGNSKVIGNIHDNPELLKGGQAKK